MKNRIMVRDEHLTNKQGVCFCNLNTLTVRVLRSQHIPFVSILKMQNCTQLHALHFVVVSVFLILLYRCLHSIFILYYLWMCRLMWSSCKALTVHKRTFRLRMCELICKLENDSGACGSIHLMLTLESLFSLCNFLFLSHRAELCPAVLSSSSQDANQSQVL